MFRVGRVNPSVVWVSRLAYHDGSLFDNEVKRSLWIINVLDLT